MKDPNLKAGGSGLYPSSSEVAPWQEAEWLLAHQLPPSLSTWHTSPPSAHLLINLPANLLVNILTDRAEPCLPGGEAAYSAFAFPALHPASCARLS